MWAIYGLLIIILEGLIMECENCGAMISKGTSSCKYCGTKFVTVNNEQKINNYNEQINNEVNNVNDNPNIIISVLALVFSGIGIIGLILSLIAIKHKNEKTTYTIGIVALIISIISTLIWLSVLTHTTFNFRSLFF